MMNKNSSSSKSKSNSSNSSSSKNNKNKDNSSSKNNNKNNKNNKNKSDSKNDNNNNNNNNNKKNGFNYYEHLTIEEMNQGLNSQKNKFFSGTLKVIATRRKVGYVSLPDMTSFDICIPDEIKRNRAVHGDVVVLQILPIEEWVDHAASVRPSNDNNMKSNENSELYQPVLSAERLQENDKTQTGLWQPRSFSSGYTNKTKTNNNTTTSTSSNTTSPPNTPHPLEEQGKAIGKQPTARVVGILKSSRKEKCHIGRLQPLCDVKADQALPPSETYVYFNPEDPRYPNMIVPRIELPDAFISNPHQGRRTIYNADLVNEWPKHSKMPKACNVKSVGEMGSIAAETAALLQKNMCNHGPFSEECLAPLRSFLESFGGGIGDENSLSTWKIPEDEIAKRRDFRNLCICSIDPPTAKDLDDALHVTALNDGTGDYEIGVHIADVTFFLQKDSPLDKEAQQRATSIYLVQKVVPMLPPILCEQLCSLNPNVDRLAFSCVWRMHANGSLVKDKPPWFGRSVIRSCAKLDYPTAQRMLDGLIPFEPSSGENPDAFLENLSESIWEKNRRPIGHPAWSLCRDVRALGRIAMARREKRLASGALVLHRSKLVFNRDFEGNPVGVGTYATRDSNRLVEEYMLLANYLVAQELLERVGPSAFIRNHPPPKGKGMEELIQIAEHINCPIDTSSAAALNESLNRIGRSCDPQIFDAVSCCVMAPMNVASYLPAGQADDPVGWRHYALAIPYYTHFTSPIRRYADCCVHRLLDLSIRDPEAALKHKEGDEGEVLSELSHIAQHCNEMKEASKAAQERSDRVFLSLYLLDKPQTATALVIGLGEKSFSIFCREYGVQDRIFIDELPGVESTFDTVAHKLVITKRQYNNDNNNDKDNKDNKKFNSNNNNSKDMRPDVLAVSTIEITLLSAVIVHLSAKVKQPPIDVFVSLVGPAPTTAQIE